MHEIICIFNITVSLNHYSVIICNTPVYTYCKREDEECAKLHCALESEPEVSNKFISNHFIRVQNTLSQDHKYCYYQWQKGKELRAVCLNRVHRYFVWRPWVLQGECRKLTGSIYIL